MSTQAVQPTADNQPATITITRAIYKMDGGLDYVYRILGYICGTLLLLLGLFITYQVIARKLGGPMAPGMDQLSGYVLAFAGTWAFSYSLRTGSHVRIDVLLPLFSRIHPYMRSVADWLALGSVGFFGLITAWYAWKEVLKSYCIRHDPATASSGVDRFVMNLIGEDNPEKLAQACQPALANTYLIGNFLPELWVFQIIVAVGFTMLAFTSGQWMLSMILRGLLEIWHKSAGGDIAELAPASEIEQQGAGAV